MKQKKHRSVKMPLAYLLLAALMLFLSSEALAKASSDDVHELADVCMKAQRALKDYALAGMGVKYGQDPKGDLKKDLAGIDEHFKKLKSAELDEELASAILALESRDSYLLFH